MSSHVADFNTRNKFLTAKFLKQGYRRLRGAFTKFYRFYYDLVSKSDVGLKSLLKQGLSEPEFYDDLVCGVGRVVCRKDFSDQFRKIIICYKGAGYNMNVMRQTACLVVNPITVVNFATSFDCTLAGPT